MKNQRKMLTAAVCAACVCAASLAFAESATFTNRTVSISRDKEFTTKANWTNATGEAVSALPYIIYSSGATRTSDTATLDDPSSSGQTIELSNNTIVFGTLIGSSALRTIYPHTHGKILYFGDPSGFYGIFDTPSQMLTAYESSSTADFTPTFRQVSDRFGVKFSNKGAKGAGKMVVEDVFGFGRVAINAEQNYIGRGHGVVEVGHVTRAARAFVSAGNGGTAWDGDNKDTTGGVSWRGRTVATAGVPGNPWLHLDASVASTVTEDSKGVTQWRDVRGAGYPTADKVTKTYGYDMPAQPRVKVRHGMRYVDFGCAAGRDNEATGGSNLVPSAGEKALYGDPASLKLSEKRSDVRDAFFVFETTQPSNAIPTTLGIDDGTTSWAMHFYHGVNGRLFADGADVGLRMGRVAVDGTRVTYDWTDDYSYRPHVVSVNPVKALMVSGLGAVNAPISGNTLRKLGGSRLGEVLVYTNKLTEAEIAQVERYLVEKWVPEKFRPRRDLEMLQHVSKDTIKTTVSVNGEGSFAIREVRFASGQAALVKDGAGTLEVDRVTPRNLPVTVNGGAVRFRNLTGDYDDTKPADDPYLWLDATNTATMTIVEQDYGGGVKTNFVTRWNDVRPEQTRYYATPLTSGKNPSLLPNVQNGLPVMDFGVQKNTKGAYAAFAINGTKRVGGTGTWERPYLEGFIVYRKTAEKTYALPIMTSAHKLDGNGGWSTRWANRGQSGIALQGGYIANNGVPSQSNEQDPSANQQNFSVYTICAPWRGSSNGDYAIEALRLCGYNGDELGGGGQIAEVIYYSRRLTPAERRNTEAYLMKKWGLGDHPEKAESTTVPTLTFAQGVTPSLGTDTDLTVGKLVLNGATSFAKSGEGALDLPKESVALTSYDVQGGTLRPTIDLTKDDLAPHFHLDASDTDASHLVFAPTAANDLNGWYDADGNGKVAWAQTNAVWRFPQLKVSDGTDGLLAGSKYVDFLDWQTGSTAAAGGSARMRWNLDGNKGKNWNGSAKEVHLVIAFNVSSGITDGTTMLFPFGDCQNSGEAGKAVMLYRAPSGQMFSSTSWRGHSIAGMTNAYVIVDGETENYDWRKNSWPTRSGYAAGTSFHVITIVTTNSTSFKMSNLAGDWVGTYAGGMKLAEMIVYNGRNNDRRTKTIHAELMKKWCGVGTGSPSSGVEIALDSVTVANGGSFEMDAPIPVKVSAVGGDGTIRATKGVMLDENLPFAVKATGPATFSRLTVDGALALPAACAVTVTVDPSIRRLAPGRYPILTADSLTGDISGWTLTPAEATRRRLRLVRVGSSVCIDVIPSGIFLLVQ